MKEERKGKGLEKVAKGGLEMIVILKMKEKKVNGKGLFMLFVV